LDPHILAGKNVTVSPTYENFSATNYTEFNVSDLNNATLFSSSFNDSMTSSYSNIPHEFFQKHKPRLCFIRYGQNIRMDSDVTFKSNFSRLFDLNSIETVQFSVATNLTYEPNPEREPPTYDDVMEDVNVETIHNTPPPGLVSVCVTESGIADICNGSSVYHILIVGEVFYKMF
jgi:hypothetical protein